MDAYFTITEDMLNKLKGGKSVLLHEGSIDDLRLVTHIHLCPEEKIKAKP